MMHQNLATLLEQADQLREGLQAAQEHSRRLNYDAVGIQECLADIQKCVRLVGNNRKAALSARDQRKVMSQLEDSVDRLTGFIG